MFKKFKDFLSKRNIIDMAVGIIIGTAMSSITKSFTNDLINPFIGLFLGKINFSDITLTVGKSTFKFGSFVDSLISFLIIALIVFIMLHLFYKWTDYKTKRSETETELLTQIRDQNKSYMQNIEKLLKENSNGHQTTKKGHSKNRKNRKES